MAVKNWNGNTWLVAKAVCQKCNHTWEKGYKYSKCKFCGGQIKVQFIPAN
jgi:rRNA maturation endonuclease Nob1